MSQRLSEFLAQEAGEYLAELQALLAGAGPVDPEPLVRLARGVRGSAQMAGAETIAAVAERLESAGRALAAGRVPWSDAVRRAARLTAADLQALLREPAWGPEQEARAQAALQRWDPLLERRMADQTTEEVVPIAALFFDDAGPHVLSPRAAAEAPNAAAAGAEPVPIQSLLLQGDEALRAALALRPRIEEVVRRAGAGAPTHALVEELFDLIRLGRSSSDPA